VPVSVAPAGNPRADLTTRPDVPGFRSGPRISKPRAVHGASPRRPPPAHDAGDDSTDHCSVPTTRWNQRSMPRRPTVTRSVLCEGSARRGRRSPSRRRFQLFVIPWVIETPVEIELDQRDDLRNRPLAEWLSDNAQCAHCHRVTCCRVPSSCGGRSPAVRHVREITAPVSAEAVGAAGSRLMRKAERRGPFGDKADTCLALANGLVGTGNRLRSGHAPGDR
jgi:hypothetical protein